MKKVLEMNINKEKVRSVSQMKNTDDAFLAELGWLNQSGISVESIYDKDEVILLKKNNRSKLNPIKYYETCKKYEEIAFSVVDRDGLFQLYEGDNTLETIISKEIIPTNKLQEVAKDYALEVIKEYIEKERNKIKINIDEDDCVEKAVQRILVLLKESSLNNIKYESKMEVVSSLILSQTRDQDTYFNKNEGVFMYTKKMQAVADSIYDEVMSTPEWGQEFSQREQSALLNTLVEKGHLSKDVANIILRVNNGEQYENILTDEELEKTVFASYLEELARK